MAGVLEHQETNRCAPGESKMHGQSDSFFFCLENGAWVGKRPHREAEIP